MAARDLRLDPDTGDLDVTGGQLALVSDSAAIAQAVRCHLSFFKGEWFLDITAGLPYFEQILVKNPNIPALNAVYEKAILAVPGVSSLVSLVLDYDSAARTLAVTFRATTDDGELITGTV